MNERGRVSPAETEKTPAESSACNPTIARIGGHPLHFSSVSLRGCWGRRKSWGSEYQHYPLPHKWKLERIKAQSSVGGKFASNH